MKDTLWAKIDIYDKSCIWEKEWCNKSDLNDKEGVYDFRWDTATNCEKWIKKYLWNFYNKTTKEKYSENWKYLDNYKFKSYGIWEIVLITEDYCWNEVEVKTEISYLDSTKKEDWDNDLWVVIEATPITWEKEINVDFDAIIKNCSECKYKRDFWDGTNGTEKTATHVYKDAGEYKVVLVIEDKYGNKLSASVVISVTDSQSNNLITWTIIEKID